MENEKISLHSAMEELVKSRFNISDFKSIDDFYDFILDLSNLAVDYGAVNYKKND